MRDAAFPLLASSIERPLKTELSPLIKKRRRAQRCPPLLTARLRRTTALRTESTIMIAAPHCPLFPNRATIMYIVRCFCDGPSVRPSQQLRARYSLQNRQTEQKDTTVLLVRLNAWVRLVLVPCIWADGKYRVRSSLSENVFINAHAATAVGVGRHARSKLLPFVATFKPGGSRESYWSELMTDL